MISIEQFYNEAMADKALEEALNKAHKENRLTEFLTEHGVDGTAEAFEALVKDKKNGSRELSDDELETATGGGKNWGDGSGNGVVYDYQELVYRYSIGQSVYVYGLFYDSKAVVIERSYLTGTNFGGARIKYPRYKVKYSKADRIFTSTFLAVLVLCVLLISVQLVFADGICSLLTLNAELQPLLYDYYIPFIIGTPLNLLLTCSVYFIRTDNRPRFSSNIIIIANVLNLLMDFVYMGVLDMGIKGSAWATVTGNLVGFIVMLTHFTSKKSTLRFDFSILKAPKEFFTILGNLIVVGASGALGTLLITVKMFFLNFLIQNTGGVEAMAAYSICMSSQVLISMFITGAAQTMILIIGVCLGEKDYDGIRFAFKRALGVLAVSGIIIMLLICAAPEFVIRLFGITSEADILNAVPAVRINALSLPLLAFSFLFLYYYMAIQRKALSTTIAALNGIVLLIPSALILAQLFGINGVWASFVAAQAGTLIAIYFITLVIKKRSKGKYNSFYLLESNDDAEIISLSFKGTKENASGVSLYLASALTTHGVEKNKANRLAVAVEGITADLAQRTEKSKKADIDIRVTINGNEIIVSIRDNGKPFDIMSVDDEDTLSDIKVVKAISKSLEYSNVLGFNRLTIKI